MLILLLALVLPHYRTPHHPRAVFDTIRGAAANGGDVIVRVTNPAAKWDTLRNVGPPWAWWQRDVLVSRKRCPPACAPGGVTFVASMTRVTGLGPQTDSFMVELPDTARAVCVLIANGVPCPLRTQRLLRPPAWVPGQPPAQPGGLAWRSFEYEADTLVAWGYDTGAGQYIGRLEEHTNIRVRPDSNAVFGGWWHSLAEPVPIAALAKAAPPIIKRIHRRIAKQIDRYASRGEQ